MGLVLRQTPLTGLLHDAALAVEGPSGSRLPECPQFTLPLGMRSRMRRCPRARLEGASLRAEQVVFLGQKTTRWSRILLLGSTSHQCSDAAQCNASRRFACFFSRAWRIETSRSCAVPRSSAEGVKHFSASTAADGPVVSLLVHFFFRASPTKRSAGEVHQRGCKQATATTRLKSSWLHVLQKLV